MSRPSNWTVLGLFVRTAVRRAANGSALFVNRARQNLAKSKGAARQAAIPAKQRKTASGRALTAFLAAMMFLGTVMFLARSIPCLTETIRVDAMAKGDTVLVSSADYERLAAATKIADAPKRDTETKEVLSSLVDGCGSEWLQKRGNSIVQERFQSRGLKAFQSAAPDSVWRGNLALISSADRMRALRAIGLYFALVGAASLLMSLGLLSRNLTQTDPALSWLFQFPVSRRTLFLAKVGEYTVDNPLGVLVALMAAILLWGCGASFQGGVFLAIVFGAAAAVSASSLRLVVEMTATQRASRKTRGAIVGTASTLGSMSLLLSFFLLNTSVTTEIFVQISERLPEAFFWNPFSLGIGTAALAHGIGPVWWIVPSAVAINLAIAAIGLATRLCAHGLATACDSLRRGGNSVASSVKEIEPPPLSRPLLSTLVWKELLQLRRQPEFLFQVLSAPLVMAFLLYIQNADKFLRVAQWDVRTLCVSIFSGAAYLLVVAGVNILRTELKTLWFLQCQPRTLADSLRTKARVWGSLAILVALILTVTLGVVQPGHRLEIAARAPFIVGYLWLLAEIVFGLSSLAATVVSQETIRIGRWQWIAPLVISAECGAALLAGDFWKEISVLSVLTLLAVAIRQRQLCDLAWITEPVESPPKRLDVLHGLIGLLTFLLLRDVAAGAMQAAGVTLPVIVSASYAIGAATVMSVTMLWLARTGRRVPVIEPKSSPWRPLAIGLAATCSIGIAWVGVLRQSTELAASAHLSFRLPHSLNAADAGSWSFLAMVVLAAPLFEEWLFRGILYRSMRQTWGVTASVALTALLFTAIHPASSSVGVLALALATALVLEKTGKLWPSMLVHLGYNACVVALWNVP